MARLLITLLILLINHLVYAGGNNVGGTIERTLPKTEVDKLPSATDVSQPEVDEFDIDNSNQTRVLIKTVTFKGNTLVKSE